MDNVITTKRTIKDILKVSLSNVLKLLAGVLVGFLLPKIIGVTDYGYFKTFTLYSSYIGLLHFGFADGIYLLYGGKNYEELERSSFRLFTFFLILLELIIAVAGGFVALLLLEGELKFLFICLAFYLLSANITNYYQIISQVTSRFNELSLRTVIQSILTCIAVVALWITYKLDGNLLSYRIYTIIFVAISIILTLWYIYTYRDITFGKKQPYSEGKKTLFSFFKIGFPLLFANLCSTFILTIDRQFVNILFETDTYAVYAFAYNMLALITTALAAISTVLYPTLKRTNKETLKNNYVFLIRMILIMVFACLSVYFPLKWFVPWFLPKYIDSLPIFRIILPGLAVSSAISIVMHNYYKTEGKELMFFVKSIIILVLSGIANLVAYSIFKTTLSISIASIIVMVVWYAIIEEYFIREYKIKWIKNFAYMVLMSAGFYFITMWNNWWVTLLIYIGFFVVVTCLFYWNDINLAFNKFLKRRRKMVMDGNNQNSGDKQ